MRVTRDIDPSCAQDLLKRVPRASLCFACEEGPEVQPAALLWQQGHYQVGISANADHQPDPGQEAVLLIDEGVYFFDLRALYIRGTVTPSETPMGAPAAYRWYELVPRKSVAWDYGMLREVKDER